MKKNVRQTAAELKKFLVHAGEEEFITAGGKASPAALSRAPKKAVVKVETPAVLTTAEPPSADKAAALTQISTQIKTCQKCPLGKTRLNAVPGEGNINARIMFVGEGPGFDEDHQGRPFIGRAGQLLTKIIESMGLKREDVFIANMVKCHPMNNPNNPEAHGNDRAPDINEIAACRKYIETQISLVSPEYVVALGSVAAKALIRDAASLGALRGQIHNLELTEAALKKPVKIIATYHPAALLRNPSWKKDTWVDLKMLMKDAGLPLPSAV